MKMGIQSAVTAGRLDFRLRGNDAGKNRSDSVAQTQNSTFKISPAETLREQRSQTEHPWVSRLNPCYACFP